jgi:hypothetical protein
MVRELSVKRTIIAPSAVEFSSGELSIFPIY